MRLDVYFHSDEATERKLDRVLEVLNGLKAQGEEMAGEVEDLRREVERNTTVEKSAVVLIQGFAAKLDAAGTDPAKLAALRTSLAANTDELAAAVAANTPAETPPPTA